MPNTVLTPPSPEMDRPDVGLGLANSPHEDGFDNSSLSPYRQSNHSSGSINSLSSQQRLINGRNYPPNFSTPMTPSFAATPESGTPDMASAASPQPFNFTPVTISKAPIAKSSVGQRRGHKYKHSSVSHSIFLEPTPRAPISLPNSLPIPTFLECWRSMSREQNTRFWWSICHALVAGFTLWSASGSLALTALSHLILYDAMGAMLCVAVDVLGNFEVWKRSSIRHPFGLERAEVLAGFAMSVLLLFMGMDLISHNIQHILEDLGEHEAHHVHVHDRVSFGEVDSASVLAIAATVVSAVVLQNHARIGKVMRFAYFENLPSILSNPSHFLTITCSTLLLLLPLLSIQLYNWIDRLLSVSIAVSMCALGCGLVYTLGMMLLMSNSSSDVGAVIRDIETDPSVAAVEETKFWQVHYGLCMANLKLRVKGNEESLTRLRERVSSLIKNRLGGGYGTGGQRWEVSTQFSAEKDGS